METKSATRSPLSLYTTDWFEIRPGASSVSISETSLISLGALIAEDATETTGKRSVRTSSTLTKLFTIFCFIAYISVSDGSSVGVIMLPLTISPLALK